jgi:hypothetical protein
MDRSGMAGGTRKVATRLWGGRLPARAPDQLVRELYNEENRDLPEPSGSQDMIGLVYPGISRLDYDSRWEGGYFPSHIEMCLDVEIARWLESVFYVLPVAPRPAGYNPLEEKRIDPEWVRRLGMTGAACYDAILARDVGGLGRSMNDCMECWEAILPNTVRHSSLQLDLVELLRYYQARCPGAMYSGCGGGYIFAVSEEPVPGAFRVKVRL